MPTHEIPARTARKDLHGSGEHTHRPLLRLATIPRRPEVGACFADGPASRNRPGHHRTTSAPLGRPVRRDVAENDMDRVPARFPRRRGRGRRRSAAPRRRARRRARRRSRAWCPRIASSVPSRRISARLGPNRRLIRKRTGPLAGRFGPIFTDIIPYLLNFAHTNYTRC